MNPESFSAANGTIGANVTNPGRFGPGSFRPGSFRPNFEVGRFGFGRWVGWTRPGLGHTSYIQNNYMEGSGSATIK